MLKIAILDMYNDVPNEGMRCIIQLIRAFRDKEDIELSYQLFNVRAKNEVAKFEDYDVFISTGGPGDPTQHEVWETKYFALIDQIFKNNQSENNSKKYLLLIQSACFLSYSSH